MASNNIFHGYAVREKGGKWEPFEFDAGEIGHEEVELRVLSCGICHAEVAMAHNNYGMTQYPFVGGHEIYGVVEKVGSGVTALKVGQRAGVGWSAGSCTQCEYCEMGHQECCLASKGVMLGRHGGFADRVRVKWNAATPIPDGVEGDHVGPLFCAGIAVFAPIIDFVRPEHKVGVIGIGGLGSIAVQMLKRWGCHVTALTSSEAKRKTALDLGAHATLSSTDEEELKAAAGRFDVVISTVHVNLNWGLIVGTLKKLGRLHILGASSEPIAVASMALIMGHKTISSSGAGSDSHKRAMLDFVKRHSIQPEVEVFPFARINDAFTRLEANPQGRLVLKW